MPIPARTPAPPLRITLISYPISARVSARAAASGLRFFAELVLNRSEVRLLFETGGFRRAGFSDEAAEERRGGGEGGASGRNVVVRGRTVGREAETLLELSGSTTSTTQVVVIRR